MSTLRALLPSRAMAVALVALFLNLTGIAYAATGGNFILGQPNTATTQTALTANFAGRTVQLTNTNASAGAAPLGLTAATGRPPFFTNSATKVGNLNADKLDGLDSTGFYRAGSTVADSTLFDGQSYLQVIDDARPKVALTSFYKGVSSGFSRNFASPGGTLLITLNASAYAQNSGGAFLLMCVLIDGVLTSACANVAVNEGLSHKALVSEPGLFDVPAGTHTVTLVQGSGTLTNNDDYDSVTIMGVNRQ
jgi:hypothetical protein